MVWVSRTGLALTPGMLSLMTTAGVSMTFPMVRRMGGVRFVRRRSRCALISLSTFSPAYIVPSQSLHRSLVDLPGILRFPMYLSAGSGIRIGMILWRVHCVAASPFTLTRTEASAVPSSIARGTSSSIENGVYCWATA